MHDKIKLGKKNVTTSTSMISQESSDELGYLFLNSDFKGLATKDKDKGAKPVSVRTRLWMRWIRSQRSFENSPGHKEEQRADPV